MVTYVYNGLNEHLNDRNSKKNQKYNKISKKLYSGRSILTLRRSGQSAVCNLAAADDGSTKNLP